MTAYRLKLAGLTDTDEHTIKSMLRLSATQLSQPWQCVDKGDAELVIYSFDSEAGTLAWGNKGDHLTAGVTIKDVCPEPVDIIFRKPLRKSSFAEALNQAAEILQSHAQQAQPSETADAQKTKPSLRSWLDKILPKNTPHQKLPSLTFEPADNTGDLKSTITDASLLSTWISQLPEDSSERALKLLTNLSLLNKVELKPQKHIELLEIYLTAIKQLLLTRDSSAVKRDLYLTAAHLKIINGINELIKTLKNGYRKALASYYFSGDTPKDNQHMLLCINRITEVTGILALHCHQYYRSLPPTLWQQLHELYLYMEACDLLHEKAEIQEKTVCNAFYPLYLQIILTSLSDPYRLNKFEVLRLYVLVLDFIDKTSISIPTEKEIHSDSSFLLTGIYTLACNQDRPPVPMHVTPTTVREAPTARTLNIQPLLLFLEKQTKLLKNRSVDTLDLEQQLLLKIAPQLKTDRERRYHRLKTAKHRLFTMVVGINAIHHNLIYGSHEKGTQWNMSNQGSGGIMAHRPTESCEPLSIGDFVGIFEQDFNIKLATVKWLQIDMNDETYIGLEYVEGMPIAASCMPDASPEEHPVLLMPSESPNGEPQLYTTKGVFSPNRKLRIKQGNNEPYVIRAGRLIDSTLEYELFSYKVTANS